MRLQHLPIGFLFFFFLTACSAEKGGDDNTPVEPLDTPAGLQVRVAGVEMNTRAGVGATNDLSDKQIVLYAVNKTEGETDYGTAPQGTQATYKVSGNTAVPNASGGDLWLTDEVATLYAGYPSGAVTGAEGGPVLSVSANAIVLNPAAPAGATLALDFTTVAQDYMYGVTYTNNQFGTTQPTVNNGKVEKSTTSSTAIGFKHAFAQIKLMVTRGDYNGTGTVTSLSYTRQMPKLKSGSGMNLATGKLTGLEDTASRSYSYDLTGKDLTVTAGNLLSVTNYALPCNAAASKIELTVDGKKMSVDFSGDAAWTAGMIYAYTVKINNTGLKMSGFTLVGWDNVPVNGGTFQ